MSDSQDCLCNHQEQISHFLQTYQHCLQIVLIMQYLQKIFCTGFAKLFNLLIFWNVSDIQIVVRFNIFNTINAASRSQQFKYLKLFLIVFSQRILSSQKSIANQPNHPTIERESTKKAISELRLDELMPKILWNN